MQNGHVFLSASGQNDDGVSILELGGGQDGLQGGATDDRLFGFGDRDRLEGMDGADSLFGGGGDDILIGGAGADSLYGDAGADAADYSDDSAALTADLGANQAFFNAAPGVIDTLISIENLVLGGGADIGLGNSQNNSITGGAGNDSLYSGGGQDTLSGGADDDFLAGGDTIDQLNGDAGSDLLWGQAGNDTMTSGAGDDVYFVEDEGDLVTEAADEGTDVVYSFIHQYSLTENVEIGVLFGAAAVNLSAGLGNHILIGNENGKFIVWWYRRRCSLFGRRLQQQFVRGG